jgi:hypothetical protein
MKESSHQEHKHQRLPILKFGAGGVQYSERQPGQADRCSADMLLFVLPS